MLPLYVTLALVTIGFVGPCLLDIATMPQRCFDLPTKRMWLVVIVAFWAFGAAAWLMAGRGEVRARRRWEATRTCFVAPDDNPEFLLELEHRIKGWRDR